MPQPIVSFDGNNHTISLFRSGKEEKLTFGKHNLEVCRAHKDEFLGRTLTPQIKGDAAADGFIYYLYAQPQNVGRPSFVWLKDKEEAASLHKAIEEAEDQEWRERMVEEDKKPCSFCGQMISDCGEDHGDEMRDIQREYWRADRY